MRYRVIYWFPVLRNIYLKIIFDHRYYGCFFNNWSMTNVIPGLSSIN